MALIQKTTAACAALVAGMVLAGGAVGADTVYRWTDPLGVFFFASRAAIGYMGRHYREEPHTFW